MPIDLHRQLEFSTHVSLRRTPGGLVMLFDQAEGIMYELNDTASDVALTLADSGPCSAEELLTHLRGRYDGPPEDISDGLDTLLKDFTELNLVAAVQ